MISIGLQDPRKQMTHIHYKKCLFLMAPGHRFQNGGHCFLLCHQPLFGCWTQRVQAKKESSPISHMGQEWGIHFVAMPRESESTVLEQRNWIVFMTLPHEGTARAHDLFLLTYSPSAQAEFYNAIFRMTEDFSRKKKFSCTWKGSKLAFCLTH